MAKPTHDQPDALLGAHARLIAGDRTAMEDFCRAAWKPLSDYLSKTFPKLEDHLRQEAASQALLEHGKAPSRYDPAAGKSLLEFLQIITWRRASYRWKREKRRKNHEEQLSEENLRISVADDPLERNSFIEEIDRYMRLLPDEKDRRFAWLLADGINDPRQLADALGLPVMPPKDLRRTIKRNRDRIRQVFRRDGPKHE